MISDEELMAYVDEELDHESRERVAAAVAADARLASRVEAQRSLRRRLAAHFDPVVDEPVPDELRGGRANRPVATHGPRRWQWQEWSAIAATLVLGVMIGPFVLRASQPLPFMSASGRVVAIGKLENALMQRSSGGAADAGDGPTIGLTFRDAEGNYCRTFAMNLGPAGLACREWGEWVVEVLARNPRARQASGGDTYRQAGTAFPAAIRDAVEARRAGDPLSADEEAAARARGWRR